MGIPILDYKLILYRMIMLTVLQFVKTQSEMTNGFSLSVSDGCSAWTTSCISRLLDFCVTVISVCMAIIQNFARCHLLQFRWFLVLSQCLQGFVAGYALNDMFRNSRLKQSCRTSSSKSVVGSKCLIKKGHLMKE